MKKVIPHDLVKYGLIPELVGRLPVITALEDLDEDSLVRILTEPKNSLVKQYEAMFRMDGVALKFTEESLRAIARKAIKRKTGARGLRGIMESVLTDFMFKIPSDETVTRIVLNEESIEEPEKVKIYHK